MQLAVLSVFNISNRRQMSLLSILMSVTNLELLWIKVMHNCVYRYQNKHENSVEEGGSKFVLEAALAARTCIVVKCKP